MHRFFVAVAALSAALCVSPLFAQKTTQLKAGEGGSPHVRSEFTVDGASITIEYGRPYVKGRAIGDVAPNGEEWRTGADEATTIKTDKALMFGALHVNPGTYTLYTIANGGKWQLIISKKTGQWGVPYPKGEDLGRIPMTVGTAPAAEQLTITIEDTKPGATLHVDWGATRLSAPFTVM
jgi:hypothetical protein